MHIAFAQILWTLLIMVSFIQNFVLFSFSMHTIIFMIYVNIISCLQFIQVFPLKDNVDKRFSWNLHSYQMFIYVLVSFILLIYSVNW